METTAAANAPQSAVVEAAPAAPAASSLNPLQDRISSARTPADLRALRADVTSGKLAEPAPAPAAPVPADEPAPNTTPETPEAEAPAVEGGDEAPEAPEAPAPDADEDDSPLAPIKGNRARLHFAENDQAGRLAASIMQRNRDLTLGEALERANKQLGITNEATKPSEETPAKPTAPQLPQSVAEVDTALTSLEEQYEKALAEVRLEDVGRIQREMRQLDRHRTSLERNAEKTEQASAAKYNADFETASQKAIDLYEFARQPDSAAGKRMLEIDAALKENNDPLYYAPDRPLKIAQMVAAELNIAPRRKGAPAVAPARPAAPAAPARPPAPKQILPSGGSRTAPAPDQQATLTKELESVKTPAQLREFLRVKGIRKAF